MSTLSGQHTGSINESPVSVQGASEGKQGSGWPAAEPFPRTKHSAKDLPESFQWLLSISCCCCRLHCMDCRTKVFSSPRSHRAGFFDLKTFPKWLSNAVFKEAVLEFPTYNPELGRRVGSVEERVPQQQMIQGQRGIQQLGQVEKEGTAQQLYFSLRSLSNQNRSPRSKSGLERCKIIGLGFLLNHRPKWSVQRK